MFKHISCCNHSIFRLRWNGIFFRDPTHVQQCLQIAYFLFTYFLFTYFLFTYLLPFISRSYVDHACWYGLLQSFCLSTPLKWIQDPTSMKPMPFRLDMCMFNPTMHVDCCYFVYTPCFPFIALHCSSLGLKSITLTVVSSLLHVHH